MLIAGESLFQHSCHPLLLFEKSDFRKMSHRFPEHRIVITIQQIKRLLKTVICLQKCRFHTNTTRIPFIDIIGIFTLHTADSRPDAAIRKDISDHRHLRRPRGRVHIYVVTLYRLQLNKQPLNLLVKTLRYRIEIGRILNTKWSDYYFTGAKLSIFFILFENIFLYGSSATRLIHVRRVRRREKIYSVRL